MSCTGLSGCVCGCCAGAAQETPGQISNRAGLSSIGYRVARFAQLKATMLARLSSSDYPALQSLRTRSDDDFSIALLDGTAMMLDVLTFYQERLANESYLRTAQNRDSVLRLAALVAYTLNPGVAAQTALAFSLKAGAAPVIIPIGTQVQSVPVSGKTAQTFETIEAITARSDWSAMAVQTSEAWTAIADQSLRAVIASIDSKVCAVLPDTGTLCTCVPMGMITGAAPAFREKASAVCAATPG